MICSEARIAANRRNSLKSTGPKTPEGKARSRANALKHGLCGTVVVAEDPELVKQRSHAYFWSLKPQNEFHSWLVEQAAIVSIRVDRCQRMERRLRDKVSLRAELTWDDDRRLDAEVLGGLLAKKPAPTVETLRRTPQGCEWLMARWAMLAHAADANNNTWTEAQADLAFDLLATPEPFRCGRTPGCSIDLDGVVLDPGQDLAEVARREIAGLKAQREVVSGLDEVERVLTESDLNSDKDPEIRRLRRQEETLHRRMRWCLAQLHFKSPHQKSFPDLTPQWINDPEPLPKPEPKTEDEKLAEYHNPESFQPPFDLTPDEFPAIGKRPDIPAILQSRKEKRFRKAEARRAADRRKLERLRE